MGLGRLGLRTGINVTQIHRGGPAKITAIDAQKISEGDLIFKLLGGKIGDYKVDLLHDLRGIKEVIPIREDINTENLDLLRKMWSVWKLQEATPLPLQQPSLKKLIKVEHQP